MEIKYRYSGKQKEIILEKQNKKEICFFDLFFSKMLLK